MRSIGIEWMDGFNPVAETGLSSDSGNILKHFSANGRRLAAFVEDQVTVVPREFDIGGVIVYATFLALVFLYAAYNLWLKKWWRLRRYGDPFLKGTVRWAAAAGDLQNLQTLSLAPGFEVESELDGFTALHAAAIGGHKGRRWTSRTITCLSV